MENRRRRQPALAPGERRAALIAATIPLLREHGVDLSTRMIAHAAGVAEGTIFGVFSNKNELVVCSVVKALDPQPVLDALAAIDRSADLRVRLREAAEIVHTRFQSNAHLMHAARRLFIAGETDPHAQEQMTSTRGKLLSAVTAVLEPDADRLRVTPGEAARLLLLYCGANTFGPFADGEAFSGAELASLLLDGILSATSGEPAKC
ncbi:TetR family transcriptional regulator [Actinoplanes sp. SE50]|uniref:TetR/AcrR family transcriptional regulator n=1 Tax=unclassified Actinoplanes TaxID=2626549 RepID=UPI00023ECD96|nr:MULTISPECIES: TetR/AcrR family transcriptional regulator [unclassified Actinoplanes]AEV87745.1 transcriptional regulator, TetR family [Actinoplanes sp. SE50/110]ATO86147.1 TetR family transcriptional regulator [Actinoplanes sp. SE50]SLM03561.1 TetR family transcriptional regulator [Actinoplanes sp. SE50/110]